MRRELAETAERRVVCWEVRARRWRNVVEADIADGRDRRGGSVVVERVYETPFSIGRLLDCSRRCRGEHGGQGQGPVD